MHAMFEAADFTDPTSWDAAIDGALAAHPQRLADEGRRMHSALAGRQEDEPAPVRLARMLRGLLADVLATPLLPAGDAAPLCLDSVTPKRRLVELGFHLPAPRLTAAQLNAWLAAHGYGVPRLAFSDLDGYLKGFIDLVFEHDGRFWIQASARLNVFRPPQAANYLAESKDTRHD